VGSSHRHQDNTVTTGRPAIFGGAPSLAAGDHRQWPIITDEDKRAVLRVLDRGILSGAYAPEALALEQELAAYVGARYALLTHSGTSALQLAVAAASIGEGAEVIVPAYSFVATPHSVALQGAVPVFADVDPVTGLLDLAAAEEAITPRTRAIMPVHVHGAASDMDALLALGKRRDLHILEDAAQAHGATFRGKPVGALGITGGFSLQSSKNLCGGEGGVFVTNDPGAAEVAASVRSFGQDVHLDEGASFDVTRPLDGTRALDSQTLGGMYRGNEMMAALVRSQLTRLPALTRVCQENAARLFARLRELPGVTPPTEMPDRTSVHHKVRVHLDPVQAGLACSPRALRDAIATALRAEGCDVVLWQTEPLPAQGVFRRRAQLAYRSLPGGTDLVQNYEASRYPSTIRLLDGSFVLFSHSCPLIAQSQGTVERYADAFVRVWEHRQAIVKALGLAQE